MKRSLPSCVGFVLLVLLGCLASSAELLAQEKSAAATRQYNAAVGLQNSESYELAVKEWILFLNNHKADPRIDRAWFYMGVCYSQLNKLDDAEKAFKTVIDFFPNSTKLEDAYLNLGLTQYNEGHTGKAEKYDEAAATFAAMATKFPEGKHLADAIFYSGEALYNRDKRKEAAEKYQQIVEKHPESPFAAQALFALGVAQTELGQHDAAIASYDDFLKKYPDNPLAAEAAMWRGESLFGKKQYQEAAAAYAAAAAKPGFAMADYATVRQADTLALLKQFAESAALYASVPQKFPKSQYVSLSNLEAGKKYYAAGDLAKCQEYLNKVIAAGGDTAPEAAHWVARCLLKEKKPQEALAVVEKILPSAGQSAFAAALTMDQADAVFEIADRRPESIKLYAAVAEKYPDAPEAPQALYNAAYGAMNQNDYQAALKYGEQFLAKHANHELAVGVMHVMAESDLVLGKAAEAEKLYRQLLEKAPKDRDAEIWKVHLGTAVYLQNRYADAITTLGPVMPEIKAKNLLAEGWYRIGRSQVALKQYEPATKSLEAALRFEPKWKLADDAHLAAAYAYQQTGDYAKAKEHAQKVVSDFPNSKLLDVAHYRLGECARLTNDTKSAVAEYKTVLDKWPDSTLSKYALYGLGWAQIGEKDYQGAEATFSALIEKHPDDGLIPRAKYGRGIARQQLKNYAPAVEDIQASLAANPTGADKIRALHILGLCQKGLNQFDQAAATFSNLLKEKPDYKDADSVYYELGWAQKSQKKDADAVATFQTLVEKFPDSNLTPDAQFLIGDFQYDKKDFAKAAVAYHEAMTKAGKSKLGEEATYKLGLTYFLQDQFENAQKTFNYQQVTWPQGPLTADATFWEAESLFKQNKFAEALPIYEKVTKPSSKEITELMLLHAADSAGQIDQWQKALQLVERLLTEMPESKYLCQALYQKGWTQQNLNQLDEALKTYEQVIGKCGDESAARAQFMTGEILFQQKKHDEAIRAYFLVIGGYNLPSLQADAIYEAARCFEVLGKKPQAKRQYQQVISRFPKSDKVPLAKQRLEALEKE